MQIQLFDQGVAFWQDKERLTIMLLSPFYSFWPRYETCRAGCPIGLELIASELIAQGFNVVFVDACMSAYKQSTEQPDSTIRFGLTDNQLEKVLANFNPNIVGITSLFSNQANNVERVARLARTMFPNAIIAEGGSYATGDVNEVLKNPDVDMVVREEGLVTFPELCQSIEEHQTSQNSTPVLGVSYKDKNGCLIHNPSRPFITNLDGLAPRRLEIPLHPMYDTPEHTGGSRHRHTGRHAYILSSMGCPMHCTFCQIHTMAGGIRTFSLARFEQDVARLKAAGVNELLLEDDMLFADVPRALAMSDVLEQHNMVWFEEGGLSMFKLMEPGHKLTYEQVLGKFAKTGCYRFYLAIESANAQSLISSHKPHINTQVGLAEAIVRTTAQKGIEGVGGFMLGFKGADFEETLADMERTVAYATRLKKAGLAYVMLFIYTAIPGTDAYTCLKSVFPVRDLRTSHERSAFPVGGLTPMELTERRLQWMCEVNGPSCMSITEQTKNWGL